MRYLDTGSRDSKQSLAGWIVETFAEEIAELRVQSGFFSYDAVGLFLPVLKFNAEQDRLARILVGSNDGKTTVEDIALLSELMGIPRKNAHLGIVNFAGAYFHPKTYHVRRVDGTEAAYVGSANLTPSGLALHIEAGITLDTRDGDSPEQVVQVANAIDWWFTKKPKGLILVDGDQSLEQLAADGVLSLNPPPKPSQSGKTSSSTKMTRPRLKLLVSLPGAKTKAPLTQAEQILNETSEPNLVSEMADTSNGQDAVPALPQKPKAPAPNPSAPKPGFPPYLLFDPAANAPTKGAAAISGIGLPNGASGLIFRLSKDSARQFAGKGGTANISIPVSAASTLRFGIYKGKHTRPRAEFDLRMRYLGNAGVITGNSTTNVMAYGMSGDTGHSDLRMLAPSEVRGLGAKISEMKMTLPKAGNLALLEWPTPSAPEFRLTFLFAGSKLAKSAAQLFSAAEKSKQTASRAACWLPSGFSPAW